MNFKTRFLLIIGVQYFLMSLVLIITITSFTIEQAPQLQNNQENFILDVITDYSQSSLLYNYVDIASIFAIQMNLLFVIQEVIAVTSTQQNTHIPEVYFQNYTSINDLMNTSQQEFIRNLPQLNTFIKPYYPNIQEVILYCSNSLIFRYSPHEISKKRLNQLRNLTMACSDIINDCTSILGYTSSLSSTTQDYDNDTIYLSILSQPINMLNQPPVTCKIEIKIPLKYMYKNVQFDENVILGLVFANQSYQLEQNFTLTKNEHSQNYSEINTSCYQTSSETSSVNGTHVLLEYLFHYDNLFTACQHINTHHIAFIIQTIKYEFYEKFVSIIPFQFEVNIYTIILVILDVIIGIYLILLGNRVGNSIDIPLKRIIKLIKQPIEIHIYENYQMSQFQDFFNCSNLYTMIQSIIDILNSVKFYDHFINDSHLLILCQAKLFFNSISNQEAEGVCASNISQIHFRNGRFMEGMNSCRESILQNEKALLYLRENLGYFKQLEFEHAHSIGFIYQRFKRYILNKFNLYRVEPNVVESKSAILRNSNLASQLQSPKKNSDDLIHSSRFMSPERFDSDYQIIKTRLMLIQISREYLYCVLLYYYNKKSYRAETIALFQQLLIRISNSKIRTKFTLDITMKCKIYLTIMFFYIKYTIQVKRLVQELDQLLVQQQQFIEDSELPLVFFGTSVNPDSLLIGKGLLALLQHEYLKAGQYLVKYVCTKQSHNSIALKILRQVLYIVIQLHIQFNLDSNPLNDLQIQQNQSKANITIVIDYSKVVQAEQLRMAHSLVYQILNNIPNQNIVSLLALNTTIFQIFNNVELQTQRTIYLQVLKRLLVQASGSFKVCQSLGQIANQYQQSKYRNYILLFSAECRHTLEELQQLKQDLIKTDLIVYDMGYNNEQKYYSQSLSKVTKNSIFADSIQAVLDLFSCSDKEPLRCMFEFL